jgi:hypothetical protein
MVTHLSIFKGMATQVEVRAAAPTDREQAEYEGGNIAGLGDGDWYYNSATSILAIRIGGTWQYIPFS